MKMKIEEAMHAFPHTIGIQQTLDKAKEMFEDLNIRHLPVQSAGSLIGVITDRDVHFALAVEKKEPEELKVEEVYTSEPYVVTPDTGVDEVARKMAHDHIGCALIAEQGQLVGIFTVVDACRVLAEVLSGIKEQ